MKRRNRVIHLAAIIFAFALFFGAETSKAQKPGVLNTPAVSHPDEIEIQPDGKISYKRLVTGEDVIIELRGRPRSVQEFIYEEKLSTRILAYPHNSKSPVKCHTSPRDDGCTDLIVLLYDPDYGVYAYLDTYIMEACYLPDDKGEFQRWISKVLNDELMKPAKPVQ